jgi:hypothetical protein
MKVMVTLCSAWKRICKLSWQHCPVTLLYVAQAHKTHSDILKFCKIKKDVEGDDGFFVLWF